jgi:hypothetical protein
MASGPETCAGAGECLTPSRRRGGKYVRTLPCFFGCAPAPCPNWRLCGEVAPRRVLDCHSGRCANCDISFGLNLEFAFQGAASACAQCGVTRRTLVLFPGQCRHAFCGGCFARRCGGWSRSWEPPLEDDPVVALSQIRADMRVADASDRDSAEEEDETSSNSSSSASPMSSAGEARRRCPRCRAWGRRPEWQARRRESLRP